MRGVETRFNDAQTGCIIFWFGDNLGAATEPRNSRRQSMVKNVGSFDRILRIVVGLVLLSLVFVGPKTWWGLIGLIPLGTAFIGFCPAYLPFGINTCKTSNKADKTSRNA
jgi:hypothetical protein